MNTMLNSYESVLSYISTAMVIFGLLQVVWNILRAATANASADH